MNPKIIKIAFSNEEQRFLSFVFTEVFGGGSTRSIQAVLGEHVAAAKELQPEIRRQYEADAEFFELTESQWRVMYESLNAVIYGLGPGKLQTCTGYFLHDACNLNLQICKHLWGAFQGKWEWAGSTSKRIAI